MFAATRGGYGYRPVTLFASTTSGDPTITVPAGVKAGDLLVMYDMAFRGDTTPVSAPTSVVASGFTSLIDAANSYFGSPNYVARRSIVSYAVPISDLGGTTLTGMNYSSGAFGDQGKILLCFRRVGGIIASPQDVEFQAPNDAADPSAQTVNAASGTAPVVVCSAHFVSSGGTLTGGTAVDGPEGTRFMYRIFNSAPSNCTADTGSASAPFLGSLYFNIT